MKYNTIHTWFTLVELIVSIMIFGIMMISVMSIFLFSSQMSSRVEINRVMQENIKNVIEDISENVRKWGIIWVYGWGTNIDECSSSWATVSSTKLCLTWWKKYVLGTYDSNESDPLLRWSVISNITHCQDFIEDADTVCRILKRDTSSGVYYPLTNSFVTFENISFVVTNTDVPKVSIHLTARPAYNKWLAPIIVENNTMHIQTTISERLIETK